MRHRLVVLAIAMLALLVSAGQAVASDQGGPAQAAGQVADGGQAAGALSGASQSHPGNQNISVRVLSPGNAGNVTQTNAVSSNATAGNANITGQSAGQTQSGSCGCEGGTQAIGQSATNDQAAAALSLATQANASNTNIPVRVLSDGNDGSVEQTNSVESDATAANINATGQSADQSGAGGSGTQAIGQSADSEQDAAAASKAEQTGAKNTNISVRVLSPGDDGDVSQSNTVESDATAANLNLTGQHAGQTQSGAGGTQAIGQSAKSDQGAAAFSAAKQDGASNTNVPVRVLSPGNGGSVTQTNSVESDATAANLNATKQDADQTQSGHGCGCSSGGTQAIGQSAKNDQAAIALSAALQSGASNTNTPVRVDSKGDDGDVSQTNSVDSAATALNLNGLHQDADQTQSGGSSASKCCESGGTQAIGQSAESSQGALAASLAAQLAGHDKCGCSSGGNSNTPVRVDSKGDGGYVDQSNKVESDATAANLNALKQDADQDQSGSGGIQAIGQSAKNDQAAAAFSAALQAGASNSNTPVRVDSYGDDGDVDQSNNVDSDATALNANLTKQDADQNQWGSKECGCHGGIGIQAIGQEAKNEQSAAALSAALQFGASNSNAPVRVDSPGYGGDVDQKNSVESDATAANLNALHQDADQKQAGGAGIAIQAIGQSASNHQGALALSAALQFGASNSNTPVRVDSKGDDGDVSQKNSVDSDATALNINLTGQDAYQEQSGRKECGCDSIGIQAIGQESKNEQGALAASLAAQVFGHGKCGCSSDGNSNTPVRVDSPGYEGSVDQSNTVDSDATAANLNLLGQHARQHQGSGGGTQAIGQSAKNRQAAFALSVALQLAVFNQRKPLLAP